MNGIRSYSQLLIEWFDGSRRLGLFAVLAVVLTTIGPSIAAAGTNTWTSNGPYGGLVTVVAQDPKTPANVYAAGFSGIYKSSNGGSSWALASTGITDPSIDAIVIDPVTPTTLYAGSIQGGPIVKSTDGAATWKPLSITLVDALAINPASTNILYAAQSQSGLQKSTDGGTTWTGLKVGGAPTFPTFKVLLIDPKTPTTVYAGEQTSGLYKSTDSGSTWTAIDNGLTGPIIQVVAVALDPQNPGTLYTAANTSGGSGVFKSTDGGANWTLILADKSGLLSVESIAVDPKSSSTVYIGTFSAGIERSTDGGATFARIDTNIPQVGVGAIAVNPQNTASLLIGTQNGIFASTNSGGAWSASSNGLALTSVAAVAVDPKTPATVYAATKTSGIFKSTDSGENWTAINNGIGPTGNAAVNSPSYTSIAIDPNSPNTVFVGSQFTQAAGVYKSTDGGNSWTVATTGLPEYQGVTAVAVDPVTTTTIYAGTQNASLFVSTDAGAHWAAAPGFPAAFQNIVGISIVSIPGKVATITGSAETARSNGSGAVAGTLPIVLVNDQSGGLVISLDGGKTWNADPLQQGPVSKDTITCVDNYTSATLYFDDRKPTAMELFLTCVSPDARQVGPNSVEVNGYTYQLGLLSDDDETSATVNATESGADHHRSAQNSRAAASGPVAVAWGLPDGSNDEAIACSPLTSAVGDPMDSTGFYAGASCGVLHGTNSGQQIATMSAGLPANIQINAIATTPTGDVIFAGAQSNGVHQFSKTSSTSAFNPDQVGLTGAWYNPATSGQGIVMQVLPDYLGAGQGLLFGGWFTYDVAPSGGAEKQRWYTLQGPVTSSSSSATIPIFASYGGNFNAPPALGAATQVGQVVMNFSDCTHATMSYSFSDGSGRSSSMPLERLSSNVSCAATGSTTTSTPDYLLSGAWFDPSTGGQGFVYDVNPVENILFAAWYTYAPTGQSIGGPASQRWYTVQAPFTAGITSLSNVPIFAATGGVFDNSAAVTTTQVGSGKLTFQSCNSATLTYAFTAGTNQGKSGTVNLSRTGFVPNGCSL